MHSESRPLEVLKTRFGYDRFLPLQEEIIANAMSGGHSLVLMPTGGGKSLCFQLPALLMDGLTLVVSPLIALMKDQVDGLVANGVEAALVNSTMSREQNRRALADARRGAVKILYVAPERLAAPSFRDFLNGARLSLVAIDEAHCISEWGHDFRPDYRNLASLRREFPSAPVMALTATATEQVRADIVRQLDIADAPQFVSSFNRPNLTYRVRPKHRWSFDELVELLRQRPGEPAIVYRFSRQDTEDMAERLAGLGIGALPYHAGLEDDVRRETQDKFVRDETPVIVATIAFGMGIDKPDVRLVVHYDLPKSLEGYFQETGRAGRDGLPSECVLFYSYGDRSKQAFFVNKIEDDAERRNAEAKLASVVDYAEGGACRRRRILSYFGERWEEENCGACDACIETTEEFDATEIAQKMLSAVVRTGERFGVKHVSDVLRGAQKARLRQLGHDGLSVYGIAADHSEDDLKELSALLVDKGLLARARGEYPTLYVTDEGRAFLRRRDSLTLERRVRAAPPVPSAERQTAHDYDEALFQRLRALRKRLADEKDVPAFVVFGDAALRDMARRAPRDLQSFSAISGVGQRKLAEYGDLFVAEVRAYAGSANAADSPQPRPGEIGVKPTTGRRKGATYAETRALLREGCNVAEIAQRRGLSQQTVLSHMEKLAADGEQIELAHLMPPEHRVRRIQAAFRAVGGERLTPVRDYLGDSVSFEEIRLVRIWLSQDG